MRVAMVLCLLVIIPALSGRAHAQTNAATPRKLEFRPRLLSHSCDESIQISLFCLRHLVPKFEHQNLSSGIQILAADYCETQILSEELVVRYLPYDFGSGPRHSVADLGAGKCFAAVKADEQLVDWFGRLSRDAHHE